MHAKHSVGHAALILIVMVAAAGDSIAQVPSSPGALLAAWQTALEQGDYAAYLACLHPGAQQVPEYGSEEAMVFWADEMRNLTRKGFTGEFAFETVAVGSERFPLGSVRAFPIVDGRAMSDAILLFQVAGQWTILRLFS